MGVDIRMYLDPRADAREVGEVVGLCMGQTVRHRGGMYNGWDEVKGVKVKNSPHVVGLVDIVVKADKGQTLVDGSDAYGFTLHLEGGDERDPDLLGMKVAIPRSRAINIAIATRLVKYYGGRLDYNDSDETEWDLIVPYKASQRARIPEDERHKAHLQFVPLTLKELIVADRVAAYKAVED